MRGLLVAARGRLRTPAAEEISGAARTRAVGGSVCHGGFGIRSSGADAAGSVTLQVTVDVEGAVKTLQEVAAKKTPELVKAALNAGAQTQDVSRTCHDTLRVPSISRAA